jgi:hypothetical protein
MTTEQKIAHIRMGIPLISNAVEYGPMMFNHGYSSAQVSEALKSGVISMQDWKELTEEISLAVKDWLKVNKIH